MKFQVFFPSLLCALLLSLFTPTKALAVNDGVNYMVHPISCVEAPGGVENGLELINGVWRLKDEAISGFLVCPINISGDSSTPWQIIQLWYRNSDPVNGYVRATIMERRRDLPGSRFWLKVDTDTDYNGEYGYSTRFLDGGLEFGHNYYVSVALFREEPGNGVDVAFVGLELRTNPTVHGSDSDPDTDITR